MRLFKFFRECDEFETWMKEKVITVPVLHRQIQQGVIVLLSVYQPDLIPSLFILLSESLDLVMLYLS